ncbi:hypothetical protein [Pseudomonas sp. AN-1]|jgi:hypothetical protein|uniref:hypothetical protein n=1 Tax=Pseudomonas sp. AN-1 TaxID=3096605 RepID=UPI002A6AFB59|nr:hypothetical protein [Pseudomonas sp. AN-1]WPP46611.1 hypothetical protein SK095_04260 [Pseudomonas sp. AN-1]
MTQHTTNAKELMLGEVPVTVREMTVLQVRNWLAEMQNPGVKRDLVGEALFLDCSFTDLQRMTTLTHEQLNALCPSQIRQVIDLCKELNPDFFAFMGLLAGAPEMG